MSFSEGTKTAVIGSPEILATVTTEGSYLAHINTSNMLAGDALVLEIWTKVLSSGASTLAYRYPPIEGVQVENVLISDVIKCDTEVVFKLNQTTGTARPYEWQILEP